MHTYLFTLNYFAFQPWQVVYAKFVVFSTNCYQYIQCLEHINFLEPAASNERKDLSISTSIQKIQAIVSANKKIHT